MTRTTPGEDENWISSQEALEMATNVLGNRADAHRQLNRRVRSGALRARAQAFLTQPDYGPIPTKLPAHPYPVL